MSVRGKVIVGVGRERPGFSCLNMSVRGNVIVGVGLWGLSCLNWNVEHQVRYCRIDRCGYPDFGVIRLTPTQTLLKKSIPRKIDCDVRVSILHYRNDSDFCRGQQLSQNVRLWIRYLNFIFLFS